MKPQDKDKTPDLEQLAELRHPSLVREYWQFLKATRKWWLLPIVIMFIILSVMILLSSSAVAPFIYSLF